MSFRSRLTLFFVLIVIVPMFSVAVIVFRLISDNETGKADARNAAGQLLVSRFYQDRSQADERLLQRASDPALAEAIRDGDAAAARREARELMRELGLDWVRVEAGGDRLAEFGEPNVLAPVISDINGTDGNAIGRVLASSTTAGEFASRIKQLSALDVVVRRNGEVAATTFPEASGRALPRVGTVEIGASTYRVRTTEEVQIPGLEGTLQFSLLANTADTSNAIEESRLLAAAVLAGFLVLAFTFAVAVSRSLQSQIERFLLAARRLGTGDFSQPVPVEGNDEFSELGAEFNKMSQQLEGRLRELEEERARLQEAVRRVGETFASGLDRDALLEIVTRTAVDGVRAGYGRASVLERPEMPLRPLADAGRRDGYDDLLRDVEVSVAGSREAASASLDGRHAIAQPLLSVDENPRLLGVLAVARNDRPFTEADEELLRYLARQASASLDNVALHELVQRQAVTDELTGLFNHRRFQEVLEAEVGRARRFGHPVGLVLLDVDNFKSFNDTYGHQQGDIVLREVARVLRESSREIDEPARYGGEEMAVVLPQTDIEGAYRLAERVRSEIEALEVPRLDGDGVLRVTASVGVAAMPDSADNEESLVGAADEALYVAKRSGKNRTVRAGES